MTIEADKERIERNTRLFTDLERVCAEMQHQCRRMLGFHPASLWDGTQVDSNWMLRLLCQELIKRLDEIPFVMTDEKLYRIVHDIRKEL